MRALRRLSDRVHRSSLLDSVLARGPIAAAAAGPTASFALRADGGVLCWGRGDLGELGVSNPDELAEADMGELVSHIPRAPSGLLGVQIAQLSAAMHVLALGRHGECYAWGCASRGVLGLGAPSSLANLPEYGDGVRFQPFPVRITSCAGALKAVAAAEGHSLAVTAGGMTLAWGCGDLGKLGVRTDDMHNQQGMRVPAIDGCAWEPVVVSGLEAVQSIRAVSSAREHSLAVSIEGRLYSWGSSRHGKLGLGKVSGDHPYSDIHDTFQTEPRIVNALREWHVLACAAGDAHSMAICTPRTAAVAAAAVAAASAAGKGSKSSADRLHAIMGVAADAGSAFALPAGTPTAVFVWGLASSGRLGLPLPPAVASSAPEVFIDQQREQADSVESFLGATRLLEHEGGFSYEQLDGAPYLCLPRRLAALDRERVVHISAGAAHSFATSAGGTSYGWGLATHGRLGVGREETLPTSPDGYLFVEWPMALLGLKGYHVRAIVAGETHAIACTVDGQMLTFGAAGHGRLGFEEGGALQLPLEHDGAAYQPMPRQLWLPVVEHEEPLSVSQIQSHSEVPQGQEDTVVQTL
jgi:alpha-tubulin suppressor-like RCC1 family protein